MSKIAWRRHIILQPSLEPIKTIQTNDVGITVYANSITLTPGTVTLSVEGNNLLVHALDDVFMSGLQDEEMDNRIKSIEEKYKTLINYFGETPKDMPMETLIEIINKFTKDFNLFN